MGDLMLCHYDVRKFRKRADLLGPEIVKDRLWVTLSDTDLHAFDVAIVAPVTGFHCHKREHEHRVEVRAMPNFEKRSDVDLRHLWTFPLVRECTIQDGERDRHLHEVSKQSLDVALAKRLRPDDDSLQDERIESLGRVVFVALEDADPRDSSEDRFTIRRLLWKQHKIRWPGDSNRLPCVVLANHLAGETAGESLQECVTVVPLIESEALMDPSLQNPSVYCRQLNQHFAVLTALLMSVSCEVGRSRVFGKSEPLSSWTITRDEFASILEDVGDFLGVPIPCPANLILT